jgi:hypothetical protein
LFQTIEQLELGKIPGGAAHESELFPLSLDDLQEFPVRFHDPFFSPLCRVGQLGEFFVA